MSKPLLAGVPALLLASAALAQPSGDARPVMVILAHPDDELPMAPALSALARAEADVRLVYATSGDAGPGVSQLEPGAALAAARADEARCSARALGLGAPMMLGFGDGKLADEARATPDDDGLIARLASEIEQLAHQKFQIPVLANRKVELTHLFEPKALIEPPGAVILGEDTEIEFRRPGNLRPVERLFDEMRAKPPALQRRIDIDAHQLQRAVCGILRR